MNDRMAIASASYSYKSYIEPTIIVKFVTNLHRPEPCINQAYIRLSWMVWLEPTSERRRFESQTSSGLTDIKYYLAFLLLYTNFEELSSFEYFAIEQNVDQNTNI